MTWDLLVKDTWVAGDLAPPEPLTQKDEVGPLFISETWQGRPCYGS